MGKSGVSVAHAKGRRERGQGEEEQGAWRGDKGVAPGLQRLDTVGVGASR
jgi:hypothetical protein